MNENEKPVEPVVKVRLDQLALQAFIHVVPPEPVPVQKIREALAKEGVVDGIDDAAIELVAGAPSKEEVLVAKGTPAQDGEDAKLEFFFPEAMRDNAPLEIEGGRVDYREMVFIPMVNPGDLLAKKTPATPGQSGRAVTGKEIPAAAGKNLDLIPGKNVALSEDKLELTAKVGGQPLREKNKLSVTPLFVVPKDLDYSVGNVSFNGSVSIKGCVLSGFSVKATGDVEIGSTVEGAFVEGGGRVTLKGGVRARSTIIGGGDVAIRFCDTGSKITCKRDLFVQDTSMHCDLTAGRKINVANDLIGGKVKAKEMIIATTVGTSTGAPTVLEIDQAPPKEDIERLKKQLGELEEQLSELQRLAQSLIAKRDPSLTGTLQKLTSQKIAVQMQCNHVRSELEEIEQDPGDLPPPRITIKGQVNPGTVIKLNGLVYHVNERLGACVFRIQDGEIVW